MHTPVCAFLFPSCARRKAFGYFFVENWTPRDRDHMLRALTLARRPRRRVSPNPRVGAVVVKRGRVVGSGAHRGAGTAHAEVLALAAAGSAAQGSDMFLNLEPCAHWGRTPPCVDAILAAGLRRVVCAHLDPDERVAGRGVRKLRRAGIEVAVGLLDAEAECLNEAYLHHRRTGRPFVTLKLALTLDARVADRRGNSRWITGDAARRLVHRWRRESDAIAVGSGTVTTDDPHLSVRHVRGENPARIVFDSRLRLDPQSNVFQDDDGARRIVATTDKAPRGRERGLEQRGVELWRFAATRERRVGLGAFLGRAGRQGITSLLIEGGGRLASAFLRGGFVDRLAFFYAPCLLGSEGTVAGLGDLAVPDLPRAIRIEDHQWRRVGEDILVTGKPVRAGR